MNEEAFIAGFTQELEKEAFVGQAVSRLARGAWNAFKSSAPSAAVSSAPKTMPILERAKDMGRSLLNAPGQALGGAKDFLANQVTSSNNSAARLGGAFTKNEDITRNLLQNNSQAILGRSGGEAEHLSRFFQNGKADKYLTAGPGTAEARGRFIDARKARFTSLQEANQAHLDSQSKVLTEQLAAGRTQPSYGVKNLKGEDVALKTEKDMFGNLRDVTNLNAVDGPQTTHGVIPMLQQAGTKDGWKKAWETFSAKPDYAKGEGYNIPFVGSFGKGAPDWMQRGIGIASREMDPINLGLTGLQYYTGSPEDRQDILTTQLPAQFASSMVNKLGGKQYGLPLQMLTYMGAEGAMRKAWGTPRYAGYSQSQIDQLAQQNQVTPEQLKQYLMQNPG